jgi:hypothetical protein
MEQDLLAKIQRILNLGLQVTEDEIRSLLVLVRKQLELHPVLKTSRYLTLNLFCNWAVHTEISQSLTGLQLLAAINGSLLKVKIASGEEVQTELSRTLGFDKLYNEFTSLCQKFGLTHQFSNKRVWAVFQAHLIEIMRDVPLSSPPIKKLTKDAKKLYDRITHNSVKLGAGVISIKISNVDYGKLGAKGFGQVTCLLIRTENNITLIIPLTL